MVGGKAATWLGQDVHRLLRGGAVPADRSWPRGCRHHRQRRRQTDLGRGSPRDCRRRCDWARRLVLLCVVESDQGPPRTPKGEELRNRYLWAGLLGGGIMPLVFAVWLSLEVDDARYVGVIGAWLVSLLFALLVDVARPVVRGTGATPPVHSGCRAHRSPASVKTSLAKPRRPCSSASWAATCRARDARACRHHRRVAAH